MFLITDNACNEWCMWCGVTKVGEMGGTDREREDHARPKTRTNFPPRCDLKIRRLSVRMRRDAAAKKVRFMDHPACLRRVRPCLYSTTCRRSPAFCSDGREGGGLPVPRHGREKQASVVLPRLWVVAAAAALAPNRPSSSLRRSITSPDSHSYPSPPHLLPLVPPLSQLSVSS